MGTGDRRIRSTAVVSVALHVDFGPRLVFDQLNFLMCPASSLVPLGQSVAFILEGLRRRTTVSVRTQSLLAGSFAVLVFRLQQLKCQ